MAVGFAVLGGEKAPRRVEIPLDPIATVDPKPGVDHFSDLPDSFVAGHNVPECGVQWTVEEVLAQSA